MLTLLLLFVLFTGVVLVAVGGAVSLFTQQADKSLAEAVANGVDPTAAKAQLLEQKRNFLGYFTRDATYIEAVLQLPLVLLAAFKVLTWFVPFFVALMGFDQLSGEVGPKSIRYLVVRVRRTSILIGKLASQVTMLVLMLAVATLLMVGVTRYFNSDFGAGAMASWGLKLFGASLLLGLTWASLTALFSALFKTPGISLVVNIIAVLLLALVSSVGAFFRFPHEVAQGMLDELARTESLAAYLRYGSVWHFSQNLIHPNIKQLGAAALMHLGWSFAFVGISNLALAKRDL